ncbi:MAG: hypothetical protein B7Z08_09615 [Sphingomonadales bacterium 32-68-7]|nr:MAG: hypothetical protein B7Z33_06675 [Sphingomonadales bacterium 12-68-11]OYX08419.1 MAG: hypothetical protein B7Z08_09615 [Sphingomonadales bacterium 32-68-7]
MASDHGTSLTSPEPLGGGSASPLVGTRAQTLQRLQVGLTGLAAMMLLVGLANILNSNLQQNEAQVVPEARATESAAAEAPPASDPLADAGVVPDLPEASAPVAPASANVTQP